MDRRSPLPLVPTYDFLGVWTWNVTTGIVIACSDVCRYADIPIKAGIHGVSTERFLAAIHPDDHDALARSVEQALHGDDFFVAEYRITSTEHGTVRVRSMGRCFRDPSGNPTHISGHLSRVSAAQDVKADDDAVLADVIEHLIDARNAAESLSTPVLFKLISAVLLEAGYHIAALLRRN
ncbi:PAS domain-containing protein [Aureimonas sp. AU4]|uniref:PAS domain-containing protein n=1 Tax=Aureimonas sp. AU4 TaxID=1638163 RepID=UPI0009E735B5|nr:PAS domain-containing protein [Aureimonas sp. AU4]